MLNYIDTAPDAADATPLVIAHGLFGSARNWGVISKRLSESRRVITVDMRNHGDSPRFATNSYPELATDLAEVIAQIGCAVDILGHSMGGKAAMALALSAPEHLRSLIVGDIAPVAYSHTQMHLIEAMQALDFTVIERRSDAAAHFEALGLDPGVQAFLLQSLDVKAKGWKLNLDALAADMDKILSFPDLKGAFAGPTLFLSGGDSDYVTPAHRPTIKALFPKARFAKIPGAAHWLHADKPREFVASIIAFLDAVEARSG